MEASIQGRTKTVITKTRKDESMKEERAGTLPQVAEKFAHRTDPLKGTLLGFKLLTNSTLLPVQFSDDR